MVAFSIGRKLRSDWTRCPTKRRGTSLSSHRKDWSLMGVISFGEEKKDDWVVARWAFCGYLEHVRDEVKGDSELEFFIDQAMALDGLHLTLLAPSIRERLTPVLRFVADEVV